MITINERISTRGTIPQYMNIEQTLALEEYEIFFNGNKSSYYGLLVSEYPTIPCINEEVEEVNIEGRNGSLLIKKGTYKNRELSIRFKMLDSEYFWSRFKKAEAWLSNITDNRLMYDRKDKCFIVKRVILGDISKELRLYGEFEVTFIVEPFLQDLLPFSRLWLDNEYIITNQGDFETFPEFKFYGNGNIQIQVNSDIFTINNVENEVTVNSELMLCYGKNKENKLLDMTGGFPTLEIGDNEIIVSSNVTKTSIKFTNYYR
ncbi:MAG: phage tail family protein [Clostridium sp.]|uniref:phage tail domain-containing protein n=1 Tax=Clostridium sp. TaxID=1506 RepID=UPI00290DCA3C|nr:phage tail domain-containing protein [Clostridium sp.]MDU7150124.1 phage tail family protein [Clostridium sp.]MDU7243375.1 phage tail family protein [Clostridium sp.]